MSEQKIPLNEKYSLTIKEAAQYFSIGVKKMRRLAEDNLGDFAVYTGTSFCARDLRIICEEHRRYKSFLSAK